MFLFIFSDRNHQVRNVARGFFTLGRKNLSECTGTTYDTERLKRNLSYNIRNNCSKNIEDMRAGVCSVLEHHFNDHKSCGDWC